MLNIKIEIKEERNYISIKKKQEEVDMLGFSNASVNLTSWTALMTERCLQIQEQSQYSK